MLSIEVFSGGVMTARVFSEILTATHDWKINAEARLTVMCQPGTPIAVDNELQVSHHDHGHDHAHYVGRYGVVSVEMSKTDDGDAMKITSVDLASFALMMQGSPGSKFMEGATLTTGLSAIKDFTQTDSNKLVTFSAVNPPPDGNGVIKETHGDSMLDKLTTLMAATGARWRARPEIGDGMMIEYGLFGAQRDIIVRKKLGADPARHDVDDDGRVRECAALTPMLNVADRFNCVYAEGGTYGKEGQERIDLCGASPPPGFTLDSVSFGGRTYCRLCKNTDERGQSWPWRRSKMISLSNLAATRDVTGELTVDQIALARAELMRRAAQHLGEVSTPDTMFAVEFPFALFGEVAPGDRITVETDDGESAESVLVYIGSISTDWKDDGGVETTLELSTRLETLADSISSYFEQRVNGGSVPESPIVNRNAYTVSIAATGVFVSYTFPETYSRPPAIALMPPGGCVWVIVSVTNSAVVIRIDTPGGPCDTVVFSVTPP